MEDYGTRLKKCCEGQCKLRRLLEGPVRTFPGNASLSQYFSAGFADQRIDPGRVALVHHEKRNTFAELEEISDKIAEIIRETVKSTRNQNPDNEAVIAVCIPPSSKLIFVLFAILKLGAAYVPIDVSFPEDRVFRIIKDCRPLLIISNHHLNYMSKFDIVKEHAKVLNTQDIMNQVYGQLSQLDTVASAVASQIPSDYEASSIIDGKASKEPLAPLPGLQVVAERTAVILYTSGSSGEPKGVRLSHRTIMNRLGWQWQEFPFSPDEICAFKASLTFIDSIAEIFGPLLQGIPLIIFDGAIASQSTIFIQKLSHYKITRITVVPTLLRKIFQTVSAIGRTTAMTLLSSVKLWICSGEPMPYDLLTEFFELYPRKYTLANFYGATELMGDVTYVSYHSRDEAYKKVIDKRVPIGFPIYNNVIYVLDQDFNMIDNGEIGEIYVAGYNLATHYVGGSQAHPDSFLDNMYTITPAFKTMFRTGDLGQIDMTQNGTRMLWYEGRVDSQYKVKGRRINIAEIELALSEIHLIQQVVVLSYRAGESDQTLLAYVVPSKSGVTLERLEPMIVKRLRDYQRPLIKFIDQIPLLMSGKVDRQRLLKMHEKEMQRKEEFEDWLLLDLPGDKLKAAKIAFRVMSQVTGISVETIAENIDNSFFNIGGTSLNAVEVVIKLRQHNLFISVSDFANAKVIRHVILSLSVLESESLGEEEEDDSVESQEESSIPKIDSHGGAGSHLLSTRYDISQLVPEDKEDVVHTIAYSFSKRGDLELYTKATYEEFRDLIENIWEDVVGKGHSFIVKRTKDQKCVGASINFDVYDEPENVECSKPIAYVLDLLEFIESRQRQKLPKGRGKLLHSYMMGAHEEVDEAERVLVVETMEEYILHMAAEKRFMGVMSTNTNPLTKQLDLEINGYEVLNEYQVNKYVAPDGTRPFLLAPDSFTIVCCWKQISGNQMDMF